MGLQNENYSYIFKTGIISTSSNFKQFQQSFISSQQASCDLFISNIFTQTALTPAHIELDQCFVPSHQTFTNKQLPYLCPLISSSLLLNSNLLYRIQKLKFIADYCVYLGLKRIAIYFNQQNWKQIANSLQKISKILNRSKIGVLIIVQVSKTIETQADKLWSSYLHFRQVIGQKISLQLCLQLQQNLPDNKILDKWMAQKLIYISFHHNTFVLNQKGYPVLPTKIEQFLKQSLRNHCNIILTQNKPTNTSSKQAYFKYFGFVLNKVVQNVNNAFTKMTEREINAQKLLDYLQSPLQPYRDNLDAEIYDIFESDHHKYNQYQIALQEALTDFKQQRTCVAYYVGSGKGLILSRLMKACKSAGKKVKVYCIEKNPFPIQSLKRRIIKNKWSKYVEVVQADIKNYVMPQHPDIIFSELLGGIGDNQLSPQCLKWAQENANHSTKFVPQKYTAFIRPISTHTLYSQLSQQQKQSYFTVKFGLFYSPFQSQKIWQFSHPLNPEDTLQRNASISWQIHNHMVIHGFEGSFDCNLYGKAYFSIVPQNRDKDFYSWFPLFFSFHQEQQVYVGQKIVIYISRHSTQVRVWYQWRYQILNQDGGRIKASEWHNQNAGTAIQLVADQS